MSPRPAAGFRFSPPALAISPAQRWALVRAFGPAAASGPSVEPEAAWGEAAALGLAPRIGLRVPEAHLAEELGQEVAARFAAARRTTASIALRYEQLAADLAELAAERGVTLVLLKGLALQLAGFCPPGERPMGDLDCLAPEEEARELFGALVAHGFLPGPAPANEQHLPALAAPVWGAVDLHFALRGLWDPRGGWWTAERLLAEGHLHPAAGLPGAWVPDREVLAAHALVHGIDQHGLAPGRHGLLRLVGDLAALLPGHEDVQRFLALAGSWFAPSVSPEEAGAALALTRKLARGEVPAGDELAEPPGTLLRHFLAAARDEAYGRSGRWRNRRLRLRRAAERGGLLRYIRAKLRPRR